jgi:hypothetical protein
MRVGFSPPSVASLPARLVGEPLPFDLVVVEERNQTRAPRERPRAVAVDAAKVDASSPSASCAVAPLGTMNRTNKASPVRRPRSRTSPSAPPV